MSKPKPKTQAQLDKTTDQRLQKTYGVTLKEYHNLCAICGGCCWICGKPPGSRRLSVDHDHSCTKVKVLAVREFDGWAASAFYNGKAYASFNESKAVAKQGVRSKIKRASVRGVACVWCNRGLRYYHDNPNFLLAAAAYLEDFAEGKTARRIEGWT